MTIQIETLNDAAFHEASVFVEDSTIPEYDWTLYSVPQFVQEVKIRPEDFGKAFLAEKVRYELNEYSLKDTLEELFDQEVVPADNFILYEDFNVEDLWDKETLGKVKKLLDDMLTNSGYFMKKTDVEVDYTGILPKEKDE